MYQCIVFDLDETIGHFSQLYAIYIKMKQIYNFEISVTHLHSLFQKYIKAFRPGIFLLFAYIKVLKESNAHLLTVLYTNTTLPKIWIHAIITFIEKKIHLQESSTLFDHVIDITHPLRKTLKKNIKDLTFICKIAPDNMAILFIDNVKHTSIHHKYMIYTHVYSYMYRYSNTSVWTSFHDILLIPITKNIKNNDVNHKFNTLCLERCNRESLSLMSQTLYISKLGDKSR